jgi:hypothetical protein
MIPVFERRLNTVGGLRGSNTGCGRNTSRFLKVNKKGIVHAIQSFISQSERTMFTIFKLLFDKLKEQCSHFSKNYVVQMPTFIFYTHLKPHSEVQHYLSGHFRWYCRDFVLDKSFQFVCCTQPTFVDFSLKVPPKKEVTSGEVG